MLFRSRTFATVAAGTVEFRDGKLTKFDLVARGKFAGEGRYTRIAPPGPFTLGVALTLSKGGEASKVAPQGARDLHGYLAP